MSMSVRIYDISQELFTCVVYPGDMAPSMEAVRRTERGDLYNLTNISLCAHNGTHVDAPFHFIGNGKGVEEIPLEKTVGLCYVAAYEGLLGAEEAARILDMAAAADPEAGRRILLKGDCTVTVEAAEVLAAAGVWLVGVESQSVGDAEAPMAVHLVLLGAEVVLLEGVRLGNVEEGVYFLSAAPIKLGGVDGAPCRAVLLDGWR